MKTVAIIEGWAGGPKLTRILRQELTKSGLKVTEDLSLADVTIAHSTGCYMLPLEVRAKLIIMLDPPYWPGRSITGRWLDLIKTDTSLAKSDAGASNFISKKLWEIYYIFAKPAFSWSVITNQSNLSFLEKHKSTRLIVIRNIDDVFCSPAIQGRLKRYKNVRYVEIPGTHDDYYANPQPYIDLLLKELK